MKIFFILPLLFLCQTSFAQTATPPVPAKAIKKEVKLTKADTVKTAFAKRITLATLSVGLVDYYRQNITLPAGFQQNNTTGFAPVFGSLEYGLSNTISIGALASYDVIYSNFYQLYTSNSGIARRYNTDRINVFRAGAAAFYHFGRFIPNKKLDVFAGIGFSLNNVKHNALPQGDSTSVLTDHTVSPFLKAGVRYYFSGSGSLFGEIGYDRQSVLNLGFSCRFFRK